MRFPSQATSKHRLPLNNAKCFLPSFLMYLFIIIALWQSSTKAALGKHKRNYTTTRLVQLWRPPQIRHADKIPILSPSGKLASHFVQYRRMVPLCDEAGPSSRMPPVPTRSPPTDPSPGSPAQKSTSWRSHQCLDVSDSSSNSSQHPANLQQPGNLGRCSLQARARARAGHFQDCHSNSCQVNPKGCS